ncbi:TPA: hypothetical protein QFS66_002316 [Enterococcus faecium]
MKKLVWIYSVNTRGGILKNSGAGMIWSRSKKLQEQLRIKVEPEWDLSIISYDITTDIPQADLIMYNEMDQAYMNDEIKKNGLSILYQDLATADVDSIFDKIEAFSKYNHYKLNDPVL